MTLLSFLLFSTLLISPIYPLKLHKIVPVNPLIPHATETLINPSTHNISAKNIENNENNDKNTWFSSKDFMKSMSSNWHRFKTLLGNNLISNNSSNVSAGLR